MCTVLLLIGSNIFLTFAWYGHLKFKNVPLWKVILVSWMTALFEYCLQVPANSIGAETFSPDQLKVIPGDHHPSGLWSIQHLLLWRAPALESFFSFQLPEHFSCFTSSDATTQANRQPKFLTWADTLD